MIVRAVQCLRLLVTHCSLIVEAQGGQAVLYFVMDKEALGTSLALQYLGVNVHQFFTVTNIIQCACGAFKVYPCVTDVWVLEFYPHQINICNKEAIVFRIFSSYICSESDLLS